MTDSSRMIKLVKIALLALSSALYTAAACGAFMPPAPPPELDDTLTDFKTEQMLSAERYRQSGAGGSQLNLPAPVLSGDEASGVARLSFIYTGGLTLFVPRFGQSIVRFVDGQGGPLEVTGFKEHGASFAPELTAALHELSVRQSGGASSGQLTVNLGQNAEPLVFTLQAKAAANAQRALQYMIYTIKVPSLSALKYYSTEPYRFVQLNSADVMPEGQVSFTQLQQVMLDGLQQMRAQEQ